MNDQPIIFIDSGIGGLPYAHFFHSRNKKETIVYIADRENFPYGPKPKEKIIELVLILIKKLCRLYDPKIITIACNTISVSAYSSIKEELSDLPLVGTFPAIIPAVKKSLKRRIGVIATQRSIEDPYIADIAAQYGPDCSVFTEAAPELVQFIERRWINADETERLEAVKPWVKKFREKGVDILVLACTHFLILKEEFVNAAGSDIRIIDSLVGVTKQLESILDEDEGKLRTNTEKETGERIMLVTGEGPVEMHHEKLCRHFGFTLAIV